jgi:hypothetical protein
MILHDGAYRKSLPLDNGPPTMNARFAFDVGVDYVF